jgi:hypothetical protein
LPENLYPRFPESVPSSSLEKEPVEITDKSIREGAGRNNRDVIAKDIRHVTNANQGEVTGSHVQRGVICSGDSQRHIAKMEKFSNSACLFISGQHSKSAREGKKLSRKTSHLEKSHD